LKIIIQILIILLILISINCGGGSLSDLSLTDANEPESSSNINDNNNENPIGNGFVGILIHIAYYLDIYTFSDNIELNWSKELIAKPSGNTDEIVNIYLAKQIDSDYELIASVPFEETKYIIENKDSNVNYFIKANVTSSNNILWESTPYVTTVKNNFITHESEFSISSDFPNGSLNLSWNKSGNSIAYIQDDDNSHPNIFIYNLNDKSLTQKTMFSSNEYRIYDIAWSPNENFIIFSHTPSGTSGSINYRLWKLDLTNGIYEPITDGRVNGGPSFISNNEIMYTKGTYEPPNIQELYRLDLNSLIDSIINVNYNHSKFESNYLSESHILYRSSEYSLHHIDINGNSIATIESYILKRCRNPSWRDSTTILVTSEITGHPDIWELNLSDGSYEQISNNTSSRRVFYNAKKSPTSNLIAILGRESNNSFFLQILESK
jgi:hypothetical protein